MYEELTRHLREHVVTVQHRPLPFPTATQADIEDAEGRLGFQLPNLLKAIYLNIGNGGFGPGRGGRIIGLRGGDRFFSGTLVEIYNSVREGAAWDGDKWIDGVLPFCGWGCNIFSCVDCNDGKHTIYQSEECDARKLDYTLDDFLDMWQAGVEILDADTAPRVTAEIINPFTGEKTRVVGGRVKKPKQ